MSESDKVVSRVMKASGESYERVSKLCNAAHEIVDECLTDGVAVVAPPLVAGRHGCPVFDRLLLRLADPDWPMPESIDVSPAELAELLALPEQTVASYPLIGRFGLLVRCLDRLVLDDDDAEQALVILDAWLDQLTPGKDAKPVPYDVWPLPGREAFQGWLLARLELLYRAGYAVRLAGFDHDGVHGQQHMFVDGRRADLLMRFTQDCPKGRAGDWLVIETKTTAVGIDALDQLALSVDWLRAESRGGEVHGLLMADGLSLEVERGLRERSFDYLSMTGLGYRKWVRAHSPVVAVPARDRASIAYPANVATRAAVPSLR